MSDDFWDLQAEIDREQERRDNWAYEMRCRDEEQAYQDDERNRRSYEDSIIGLHGPGTGVVWFDDGDGYGSQVVRVRSARQQAFVCKVYRRLNFPTRRPSVWRSIPDPDNPRGHSCRLFAVAVPNG